VQTSTRPRLSTKARVLHLVGLRRSLARCGRSECCRGRTTWVLRKLNLCGSAEAQPGCGSAPISVCHLPPGTSKWNKIEHRLFSFITQNWRGKPLVTHQVIVSLIAATTTKTGLTVRSRVDDRIYPKGRRVSDKQLSLVNLEPHSFHGEWNYTIRPTVAP